MSNKLIKVRDNSFQKENIGVQFYIFCAKIFIVCALGSLLLLAFVSTLPQDYEKYNVPLFFGVWLGISKLGRKGCAGICRTSLAMEHTLFRVSIYDGNEIVAMARMIGDMGLDYYIKDVVVKPEYQGKGIGRLPINELLKFIKENGVKDTEIFVELCAVPDKIPFYEKFGFNANEAQRLKMMCRVE